MTDLERAQVLLARMEQARLLIPPEDAEFHAGLALINALAAARREGYLEGAASGASDEDLLTARAVGAAWMRERAERVVENHFPDTTLPDLRAAIRALPLTPEKPTCLKLLI